MYVIDESALAPLSTTIISSAITAATVKSRPSDLIEISVAVTSAKAAAKFSQVTSISPVTACVPKIVIEVKTSTRMSSFTAAVYATVNPAVVMLASDIAGPSFTVVASVNEFVTFPPLSLIEKTEVAPIVSRFEKSTVAELLSVIVRLPPIFSKLDSV